jgi:phosphoenolpyruvate carboxykinase (GTP)
VATPLENWVEEAARLTKPERVVHCDGSDAENQCIIGEMLRDAESIALNEKTFPNCYLHRSSPNDVARRTSHLHLLAEQGRRGSHE